MDPSVAYQVYKDAGVAALFIVLYLTTIFMFIKTLNKHAAEQRDVIVKVTEAVVQVARVCEDYKKVCENLQRTMEQKIAQDATFMAFLKGRDSRGDNWNKTKGED